MGESRSREFFLAKRQITVKNKSRILPALRDGGSVRRKCRAFGGSKDRVSKKEGRTVAHQAPKLRTST